MSDRIDTGQTVEPAQPPLDVDGPDALAWNEEVYPSGPAIADCVYCGRRIARALAD